jgi:hypothetical protein
MLAKCNLEHVSQLLTNLIEHRKKRNDKIQQLQLQSLEIKIDNYKKDDDIIQVKNLDSLYVQQTILDKFENKLINKMPNKILPSIY